MDERYEKLLAALEEMVNNGTEQLPLIMEEIVRWTFYKNLGFSFICVLAILVSVKMIKNCYRDAEAMKKKAKQEKDTEKKNEYEDLSTVSLIMAFVFIAVGMIALLVLVPSVGYTIKSIAAPRVVIIEYLRDLSR